MEMEKDSYYVERCLDGHPDDFRHLVRRYQPVLLAHLAGKLGHRDRAEEAAQETADQLVQAGVRGILNFSPRYITVPKRIKVITIDIAMDLARLPYYMPSS